MTTIETIISHPAVASAKEWRSGNLHRHYLSLRGFNSRFAGDRNLKVYVENDAIVIEGLKGTMSDELWASVKALRSSFETTTRR